MFKDGHVISGTLSGLIERLVPLPIYYPDVSGIFNSVDIIVCSNELRQKLIRGCCVQQYI